MIVIETVLIFLVYFFPSFLAYAKKKRTFGAILIINTLFGITILGWILALGLVFRPDHIARKQPSNNKKKKKH